MAPGSVASSDTLISSASLTPMTSTTSTTSMTSTSGWSGAQKPGPSHSAGPAPRRNPPMLRMVLEALQAGEQRRGTSVAAIKVYILQKYPTVDAVRLKYLLKRALDTGMQRGLLSRPTNSKAKGATGSFKLVPKHKKKIQPRKTSTLSARQRPGEAKEEAPKKGGQTKDGEARVGKAKKVPQQPDKATKAPPGASGPHGKSKVKGRKNSPADAKAHRKTKTGTQSSKPTVTKGENGVASAAKKKTGTKVLKEATAQGAREGSKAKVAAAPKAKDSGSKMIPVPLPRKTEVPKGPRKPGMPTKVSSSKGTNTKAEAKS
ncbi:PREDICTED: histone H1oo [Miniopterus natalensis]|uniref:histone H1oo n=1 Tax=Miniopterus natalensis TaxID=291302 RepID=UPI0007A6DDDB|nr:PREDICTED: histone H1oo [Miniopterus natalensis]